MYLTAQRVRTRDHKEGVNTFLYVHGDRAVPGISWTHPNVAMIADEHPGTLVLQRIEQGPGMNDVLSFLDVVADDAYNIVNLRASIAGATFDPSQAIWSDGHCSFRFFYSYANRRDVESEFRVLREHALFLLPVLGEDAPPVETTARLRIISEDNEALGVVYRLDVASQRRLRSYK